MRNMAPLVRQEKFGRPDGGHRTAFNGKQVVQVSGTAIVILIVVIVVLIVAAAVAAAAQQRRRLQQRFGPEYDRAVGAHDSRIKAEAELTQRQRRVRQLDLRPLSEQARDQYAARWTDLQEQFVDAPQDAVAGSQELLSAVMSERGYPTEDHEQMIADLSVEHAATLGRYRAAEEISQQAVAGSASTEDLRQAMIHYRALFRELLGGAGDDATGSDDAASSTAPGGVQASDTMPDGQAAGTDDDAAAADVPLPRRRS